MKIVLLAGKGESTTFMYNGLHPFYSIERVLIEDRVPAKQLVKRRIKKLGFFKVMNQLLFQITISKALRVLSKKRIKSLKSLYKLSSNEIPTNKLNFIPSVNDRSCMELLQSIQPDVVIVNGTRIISKKILQCIDAVFINSHVGITPQYRGVHGGYWALANNDKENCGVTIHLVDPGIDTGSILQQAIIFPENKDNFITYPYHQYGLAINMMREVLKKINENQLKPYQKANVKSYLYYHPTFTGYLYYFFFKGIK